MPTSMEPGRRSFLGAMIAAPLIATVSCNQRKEGRDLGIQGDKPTYRDVEAFLTAARDGKKVHATLVVKNLSADRAAALWKWNIPTTDGELENDVFVMKKNGDALSGYRGRLTKRAPPQDDDYDLLRPGTQLERRVVLTDYYDIPEGPVVLWYEARHGSNEHGDTGDNRLVKSNAIELS